MRDRPLDLHLVGVEDVLDQVGVAPHRESFERGAMRVWDAVIARLTWFDRGYEPAAIIYCQLWAQFRRSPADFPAAKYGLLRSYARMLA